MAKILEGAPVAGAITDQMKHDITELSTYGIRPTLAILRVGENHADKAYEQGIMKFCAAVGVGVRLVPLPEDVEPNAFFTTLQDLNTDRGVHGILIFRPLPAQIDDVRARRVIAPEKDVDGCTDASLTGVFTNEPLGFTPCTAQAVMEMLHFYDIPVAGKHAVIIGRSLVVGRPLAMLLMHENATVTICHTGTVDVPALAREADMLVACAGQMESVDWRYINDHQVVLDVGVSWNSNKGGLCGDVQFDEARKVVTAISPVPGGVGTVTTSVLISHVVEAARREIL